MQKSNQNLSENSILQLQKHSVLRDDLVCFNQITGEVITLNQTGYLFLMLVNGNRSVNEISICLANRLKYDTLNVIKDALDFYTVMIQSEIIKIKENE